MRNISVLLFSAVLLCLGAYSLVGARDSGVELIVTQRTADYVNKKLVPILKSKLSGFSIPDQRFGRVRVYSIRVGAVHISSHSISFTSSGAVIKLSGLSVSGSLRWKYKRWFFRASGSIYVSLSSGHLSTTLSVAASGGRPDFNVRACSVNARIKLRFRGSFVSWILNLLRKPIERKVESYLRANTCKHLTSALNQQERQLVTSYPTSLSVGKILKFDISLPRDPKFGRNFLQIPFVGFTSSFLSSSDLNYLARKYPSRSLTSGVRTNRMLFFRIKPYSLNAALLAYHRAGVFSHEYDVTDFSKYVQSLIGGNNFRGADTLCSNPADCALKVKISTPSAPTVKLGYGNIRMTGKVVLDVELVNSKRSLRQNLLRISVDGEICGQIRIQQSGTRLTAFIKVTCAKSHSISVQSSLFGHFSSSQLNQLFNSFIQQLIPEANTRLSSGMPIQQPGTFTIKHPLVSVRPQYLEVGANFAYNRWG